MTVWKNGILLLLVVLLLLVALLLLVVLHLHGHLLLHLLDQHSCCCSKYEMTVWKDGSYPPSCEELYFQQKLCRQGKTNAHRGTNPAVGWGKCESRELPWNPGFLWPPSTRPNNYIFRNTKYQNIFLKKTDVVVGRVPWWWWMDKKALLAFSSSLEFLLPSECLNIQHHVLCGNKTNILQTIWCRYKSIGVNF